jgi:hypothetical protein
MLAALFKESEYQVRLSLLGYTNKHYSLIRIYLRKTRVRYRSISEFGYIVRYNNVYHV